MRSPALKRAALYDNLDRRLAGKMAAQKFVEPRREIPWDQAKRHAAPTLIPGRHAAILDG